MIKAASEVTMRGLARITLLGDEAAVQAEAKKLGADISKCKIVDPKVGGRLSSGVGLMLVAPQQDGACKGRQFVVLCDPFMHFQ